MEKIAFQLKIVDITMIFNRIGMDEGDGYRTLKLRKGCLVTVC